MRNNVPALDSLFPTVRQGTLAGNSDRAEKWWYLSELAESPHARPSNLQREMRSLEESGILQGRFTPLPDSGEFAANRLASILCQRVLSRALH